MQIKKAECISTNRFRDSQFGTPVVHHLFFIEIRNYTTCFAIIILFSYNNLFQILDSLSLSIF
jgi:hypothetical protein